jgi:hypothetical protein
VEGGVRGGGGVRERGGGRRRAGEKEREGGRRGEKEEEEEGEEDIGKGALSLDSDGLELIDHCESCLRVCLRVYGLGLGFRVFMNTYHIKTYQICVDISDMCMIIYMYVTYMCISICIYTMCM